MVEEKFRANQAVSPVQRRRSLSPTAGLCAAVQAAEAIKLLCGRGSSLTGRLLWMDLLEQEYQLLPF